MEMDDAEEDEFNVDLFNAPPKVSTKRNKATPIKELFQNVNYPVLYAKFV